MIAHGTQDLSLIACPHFAGALHSPHVAFQVYGGRHQGQPRPVTGTTDQKRANGRSSDLLDAYTVDGGSLAAPDHRRGRGLDDRFLSHHGMTVIERAMAAAQAGGGFDGRVHIIPCPVNGIR